MENLRWLSDRFLIKTKEKWKKNLPTNFLYQKFSKFNKNFKVIIIAYQIFFISNCMKILPFHSTKLTLKISPIALTQTQKFVKNQNTGKTPGENFKFAKLETKK